LSERQRVTAAAARAQREIAARNSLERQSSVITWNGRPARTIALAVSCAPWMPWLYVRSAMSQSAVTSGTGWMFARQIGNGVSASSRATRIAGPYVSITTSRPSRPRDSKSRITRSASSRSLTGGATSTSASPPSAAPSSAAHAPWRSVMPGSISS
jgi:hypothetical protein